MNWLRKLFNKIFNGKKRIIPTLDKMYHYVTISMIMNCFRNSQIEVRSNVFNSVELNVRRNVSFVGTLKSTNYSENQLETAYKLLETI